MHAKILSPNELRELELAKFRGRAELEELVAGALDDFAFQCDAADEKKGEQPVAHRRALIELAAAAMRDVTLVDCDDPRNVIDEVTARFKELLLEAVDGQ